jgi:hypothetical protein
MNIAQQLLGPVPVRWVRVVKKKRAELEAKIADDKSRWKATVKLGKGAGAYSKCAARLIAVKTC